MTQVTDAVIQLYSEYLIDQLFDENLIPNRFNKLTSKEQSVVKLKIRAIMNDATINQKLVLNPLTTSNINTESTSEKEIEDEVRKLFESNGKLFQLISYKYLYNLGLRISTIEYEIIMELRRLKNQKKLVKISV